MTLTPKLKAQELVDKMYFVDDPMGNYPMCFETAKQCALITVDEILDASMLYFDDLNSYVNFWQQVKTEIQAL
jgi:hypothetical protein